MRRYPGLDLREHIVLQVSSGHPLVLSAGELYRLVSMDNVAYREAIRLGKRWASGELRARPLPALGEAKPPSPVAGQRATRGDYSPPGATTMRETETNVE